MNGGRDGASSCAESCNGSWWRGKTVSTNTPAQNIGRSQTIGEHSKNARRFRLETLSQCSGNKAEAFFPVSQPCGYGAATFCPPSQPCGYGAATFFPPPQPCGNSAATFSPSSQPCGNGAAAFSPSSQPCGN